MTALIEARGAAFGYGRRTVLHDVNLAVEPGSFLAILGPNGGGKTTLFRGLLGLVAPLAGRVVCRARAVGYVPQREVLDTVFPLTVEEVVHMGAYGRLRGLRKLASADRTLALECLGRVGLAGRRHDLFASLSGGQRQRVLIARALMVRPQIMLLDEPTSGVDAGALRAILELLDELRRAQTAILLVSHQIEPLRHSVDGALWVSEGRVRRRGRDFLDQVSSVSLFSGSTGTEPED